MGCKGGVSYVYQLYRQTRWLSIQVPISFIGFKCVQSKVKGVHVGLFRGISLPTPAEAVCVIVYFTWSILDLKVVIGKEEGPPGEFGVLCFRAVEVLEGCMVGDNYKLRTCQVGVKFRDCKN
jgi:hypothetical protein